MSNSPSSPSSDDIERISESKVTEIIEEFESESKVRNLSGIWRWITGLLGGGISVFALYWTQYSIATVEYRAGFLTLVLILTFLLYPLGKRGMKSVQWHDVVLSALALVSLGFLILTYRDASQRITSPTTTELILGGALIVLLLEATRRTTGAALSITAILFLLYAYFGPYMPEPFDHRGYRFERIIGQNYLTLEGIFGVPLDVASSFIVLFTIYGAVLEFSGAGKFFLDWSFSALGKSRSGAGPGRTVTAAGFLLGTVSGSGVATTVTLGSLAWPMLKKAGYDRETAGGILSAAGIGATLSPPTLGAAAFLIAEYLQVSYLDIIIMASIPTILYYLSCLLMIEADSRRMRTHSVDIETQPLSVLTRKYGYHFTSLFAVAVLMAMGLTPFLAVFWSVAIAFALSYLSQETRLSSLNALGVGVAVMLLLIVANVVWPSLEMRVPNAVFWGMMTTAVVAGGMALWQKRQALAAKMPPILAMLEAGGKGAVSIAATTACAGIIVSVVTLTGLGLKMSGLIVDLSGGSVFLTVLYAAIAVWILGLAVPVTASYIIAAVVIVPALTKVGVPDFAAHMFIFYYAVLADVSPPTALAPSAAAALTGGKPFQTMMLAWKYCLPGFVVPFMFCLSAEGSALLLKAADGRWLTDAFGIALIFWTLFTSSLAVAMFAVTFGGWFIKSANVVERVLMCLGGIALLAVDTRLDMVGFAFLAVATTLHITRTRKLTTTPAM